MPIASFENDDESIKFMNGCFNTLLREDSGIYKKLISQYGDTEDGRATIMVNIWFTMWYYDISNTSSPFYRSKGNDLTFKEMDTVINDVLSSDQQLSDEYDKVKDKFEYVDKIYEKY